MLTRGGRGCAGLCPPGCPPLPRQSRATTSSARVLAVNEITATARPLCRRRRSGQHPVSTWIHGNVALISMAEGGWAGDASRWRAQSSFKGPALRWSWAIPRASGKPTPLQPSNQDLGEKEPFPRATSPRVADPHQGWDFAVTNEQHKSPLRGDEAGIACLWSVLGSLVLGGGREPSPQPDPPQEGLGALAAPRARR